MRKSKKMTEPKSEPLGVWLWLDTEGRVEIARRMPEGRQDEWLGFPANPPLTQSEAETIRNTLCDLRNTNVMGGPAKPAWFFRTDPGCAQGVLIHLFRQAVAREADKRTHMVNACSTHGCDREARSFGFCAEHAGRQPPCVLKTCDVKEHQQTR